MVRGTTGDGRHSGAGLTSAWLTTRDHERMSDKDDLEQLGRHAGIPASPDEAVLETVPNPHPDTDYTIRLTAPEFTSLCPVTGQPDFAHLVIDYVPATLIV